MIRYNGGIDYIIVKLTRHVNSKRAGELSIAGLVCLANLCTANNTIAVITIGPIAKNIADRFGIDCRKSASILDTFSCFIQGIIPYGAQMLIAAGLASISPLSIIQYLYYPMLIGICALSAIVFRYPQPLFLTDITVRSPQSFGILGQGYFILIVDRNHIGIRL